jgi:hypothetical protein
MGKKEALARKEAAQDDRDAAAAASAEAEIAKDWQNGAKNDKKGAAKAEAEAERLRKAAEKKRLEEMDAADAANIVVKKGPTKKNKNDDFAMLEAGLKAAPKTKAQREAEAKAKLQEEKKKARALAQAKAAEESAANAEKEEANRRRLAAKGIIDQSDDLLTHSKSHNKLDTEDEMNATGIDSAIGGMSLASATGSGEVDAHPERRMKALYNEYFERELPVWKENHPGLRLGQYKERIFDAWQKDPSNPRNAAAMAAASEGTVFTGTGKI